MPRVKSIPRLPNSPPKTPIKFSPVRKSRMTSVKNHLLTKTEPSYRHKESSKITTKRSKGASLKHYPYDQHDNKRFKTELRTANDINTKTPKRFHIKTFDNRFLGNGIWGLEILGDTNEIMHLENHGNKVFSINKDQELCDETGHLLTFLPHGLANGAFIIKVKMISNESVLEAINASNNSGGKFLAAAKDCLELSDFDDSKSKFDLMATHEDD
ncbi:hypothetical protein G9A89_008076 [Geosiphon pyriformis]|nr:hypothetical protein G9A89_008076 [Geosiphon pyriformis]